MARPVGRRIAIALACLFVGLGAAAAESTPENRERLRGIFEELININTTDSSGTTTAAAEAVAKRLEQAGFAKEDIRIDGANDRRKNLVARLRGSGARPPLLLLAHLDVVEARRQDWSMDPFHLVERVGYFYGRGTSDDKCMAAIWIANLIRLKQEGFRSDRDLIVALTAGEESGVDNGVQWLLDHHRDWIAAAYALNEGGGGQMKNGQRILNSVQASEKVYLSFRLEARNNGGHSSRPRKDNAIYELAAALERLSQFQFPVDLGEVTRTYFSRMSELEQRAGKNDAAEAMQGILKTPPDERAADRLSQDPYYNALLRTTCVATQLAGGHAENALPQTATAVVNCRILPGRDPVQVRKALEGAVADPQIAITEVAPPKPSPPSPLTPEIMQPVERITEQMWPGVPVVPVMSTGATDGSHLRRAGIPTYGVSGLFEDVDDVREHGRDERVGVAELYQSQEFLLRLVKALASDAK